MPNASSSSRFTFSWMERVANGFPQKRSFTFLRALSQIEKKHEANGGVSEAKALV